MPVWRDGVQDGTLGSVESRDATQVLQTDASYTKAGSSEVAVPVGGTYLICMSGMFFNAGGGASQVIIDVAGSQIAETERSVETSAFAVPFAAQARVTGLAAGTLVQIRAKKGGSANIQTKNRVLTAVRVGP